MGYLFSTVTIITKLPTGAIFKTLYRFDCNCDSLLNTVTKLSDYLSETLFLPLNFAFVF